MNVSVIAATYGSTIWQSRAAEAAKSVQDADETIVLHLVDGTLAQARNTAAASATGDWLCFLDADDELGLGYLDAMRMAYARASKRLQQGDVLTASGPRPAHNAHLAPPLLLVPSLSLGGSPSRIPDWDRLLIDLNCAVIGTLVPRRLFEEVGGFREWPIYEDWDLWLRCVRAGARLLPVPDAVYRARMSDGSRNQQAQAVRASTYAAIRAEHDDVPPSWWRACKVRA